MKIEFSFFFFFLSIVDLGCCVPGVQQSEFSYTYIHSFPLWFIIRVLTTVPCAMQ